MYLNYVNLISQAGIINTCSLSCWVLQTHIAGWGGADVVVMLQSWLGGADMVILVLQISYGGELFCVSGFMGYDVDFWVLGDVFINIYYVAFDYENKRIGIARSIKQN